MPPTAATDLLLDRRRLKRRLFVWRGLAILAVAAALVAIFRRDVPAIAGGPHIERLRVTGIITENDKLLRALAALAKNPDVAALVIDIDSPGGSVAGGESLHDAIVKVAAVKPVVAVMGATAASAGYMIAVPAARIYAREATLTGSIGVILETGEASGLLHLLGLSADAITSGPLKDQPSFTRPLTDQGRAYLHGLVMDMFDQFVTMVAAGRHMDKDRVLSLADGRAYTGRQALGLGLIDAIGGEAEAREWLEHDRHVPADLPVRDVDPDRGMLARQLGIRLPPMLSFLWKSLETQGLNLDGAWAIWQPGDLGG
jgi:protease-4